MAIQTLVPQYYDYQNSNATIISSSGTFVNYHHYVNDSTNNTYLQVSGDAEKMSFGFGDIILRPKAVTVNITASGDKNFYFSRFNENTNNNSKLFTNRDNDSIIATHTDKYCASSGRFDIYSYNLDLCYSGYNLTDLENAILNITIVPSSFGQTLISRISKIDVVVSGDPLYANDVNFYIPGDVTNRLIESYPLEAESTGFTYHPYADYPVINSSQHILRANFLSSDFNLGHYLFDELSGNTIYSSGIVASGIVKDNTTPWYNYYRNPVGNSAFRQAIDVRNYIDFGAVVPTGDFTIYMRFLASGETRRTTSGYGYNDRCLFSAGDISIKCVDNTDDIEIDLAGNALQHTTYFSSGVWEDLLVTYKNNLLSYYISDELHAQSYIPNRINASGNVIIGGYTSLGFSGGTVPYYIGAPFGISEFGLSSYGFTESQVYDFYGSLGYSRVGYPAYLSESIHPSADTTYIYQKLMNASGEYQVYTRIAPSSFSESVINITSPFVMNDELIAGSSITVTLGISSNTTNPSGIIIGGFQDENRDLSNYPYIYKHRQEFFEHYLPSGSYNGFITLSGFKKILSTSGNYYNDSYDYITPDLIDNIGIFVKNPYSPSYSSETKIHSVKINYDAWLIPETGYNSTTLYISGAPIVHNDIDLFIEGEETHDNTDLFIQGLLPYSGNTTLFVMGGIELKNADLFIKGKIPESGNISLFIAGQTEFDTLPLYMHNEYFTDSGNTTLYMFATSSGVYGVNGGIDMSIFADVSESMPLYLHNEDDATNLGELPLVMYGELIGGTKHTTMYIANSGFESEKRTTMYLLGDYSIDTSSNMPLFINRLTSNDAHFTTMFVQNNGSEIQSTLYTKGAYISNTGVTLFMPSSFTPTTNRFKMYTHGF